MDEWVFVDTCIWASFFSKPSSPEKAAVDHLLDADRVGLVVLAFASWPKLQSHEPKIVSTIEAMTVGSYVELSLP